MSSALGWVVGWSVGGRIHPAVRHATAGTFKAPGEDPSPDTAVFDSGFWDRALFRCSEVSAGGSELVADGVDGESGRVTEDDENVVN